jgi:5-methylthioadenosine/S-adenosylhomocysteine deaminase
LFFNLKNPMYDLIIHNCHILTPEADIQRNCDLVVDAGQIVAIQPAGQADLGQAHEILEANEMLAMPGLINTHAHVPMVIFRGLAEDVSIERWFNEFIWPLESNLIEEDVYWGMLLGLVEMIEGGVTTVADHYFFMDRAAQAVQEAGTRAALGWGVFGDRGYEALAETASFAERWQGQANGRITTWMAPHAPYTCDDDFLRATVAHARRLGVGIHIHAAEEMGQTQASLQKRGLTPIQVLAETGVLDGPTIIAHGCGLLPQDIDLLKQAPGSIGIAHAPKTYLKLGMGLTPILALREAGIPVGLATDGAVSNNTLDIFESLRLMAMLQKHETRNPEVMTIPQALAMATRDSAAVIGLAHKIGQLTPGYLADIILIDLSGAHHQPLHSLTASLVYNARASDVQTVIVNGEIIMRDRRLLTLDKAEIIRQVNRSMARLAQRVPGKRIQVYNP